MSRSLGRRKCVGNDSQNHILSERRNPLHPHRPNNPTAVINYNQINKEISQYDYNQVIN